MDNTKLLGLLKKVHGTSVLVQGTTLLAIACFLCFPANAQVKNLAQEKTIVGNGERPLADALSQMQKLFAVPVSFEEARVEDPAYLQTVTVTTLKGVKKETFRRHAQFRVIFTQGAWDLTTAAQTVLSAYSGAGLPGKYTATFTDGVINILPSQTLDAHGSPQPVAPVMSRTITIPRAKRECGAILNLIAQQLSTAIGMPVLVLTQPFHDGEIIAFEAQNEPASQVIADLGAKIRLSLSFQLLYDMDGAYYLNVSSVFQPSSFSPVPLEPKGNTTAPPSGSPFFVKVKPS